ncbi:hypothetical protein VTN31DRAFT_4068 [Thermomyces dupontii]|uniref:uncharacterized protein n=1 Tax=Talaromyces thermophilus TaxID=28565 RepID=UPI0037426270
MRTPGRQRKTVLEEQTGAGPATKFRTTSIISTMPVATRTAAAAVWPISRPSSRRSSLNPSSRKTFTGQSMTTLPMVSKQPK